MEQLSPEEQARQHFEKQQRREEDRERRKQAVEEEARLQKSRQGPLHNVPVGVAWGLVVIIIVLAVTFYFLTQ